MACSINIIKFYFDNNLNLNLLFENKVLKFNKLFFQLSLKHIFDYGRIYYKSQINEFF